MNEIKEIDFSNDSARVIEGSSNNIRIEFHNGHSLKINWDLVKWIKEFNLNKE